MVEILGDQVKETTGYERAGKAAADAKAKDKADASAAGALQAKAKEAAADFKARAGRERSGQAAGGGKVVMASRKRNNRGDLVQLWQHDRVLALLLAELSLTSPIGAPSGDLSRLEGNRTLVVDHVRKQTIRGKGILDTKTLGRTLADQEDALKRFYKMQARELRRKKGLG